MFHNGVSLYYLWAEDRVFEVLDVKLSIESEEGLRDGFNGDNDDSDDDSVDRDADGKDEEPSKLKRLLEGTSAGLLLLLYTGLEICPLAIRGLPNCSCLSSLLIMMFSRSKPLGLLKLLYRLPPLELKMLPGVDLDLTESWAL